MESNVSTPTACPKTDKKMLPYDENKRLPIMEARNLSFSYGKQEVLHDVNLCIRKGEITTIIGANGGGKSTLFDLMTKNLHPDHGKVFLKGKNIERITLREFSRSVAMVHQDNTSSADLTVERLVNMGRTPYLKPMGHPGEQDIKAVEWAMSVTGVSEFRSREMSRLSGGQRQRAWIAMALAQETELLFLDEPTTFLDVRYQVETLELIQSLNREHGKTIVMILHDINQAIVCSDRIVALADGHVVGNGTPDEVMTEDGISSMFGINLDVVEINGQKQVVLPLKRMTMPSNGGDAK